MELTMTNHVIHRSRQRNVPLENIQEQFKRFEYQFKVIDIGEEKRIFVDGLEKKKRMIAVIKKVSEDECILITVFKERRKGGTL